jgi:hypothetical protein
MISSRLFVSGIYFVLERIIVDWLSVGKVVRTSCNLVIVMMQSNWYIDYVTVFEEKQCILVDVVDYNFRWLLLFLHEKLLSLLQHLKIDVYQV